MKAYTLYGINDLRFEEKDIPKLMEDEVLVKVKAAGICGSDIPRIYKTGAHVSPLVPGHEFSGEIVDCNVENVDKSSQIGKRVGIFPLIPCKKCAPCKLKKYEMCRNYRYLGSRCDGGFAEYVAVPKWNVIDLPENVSYEEAAMLEPMAVAVHSIRRTNISKDSRVVVCGLGTIGLLITMFLVEQGVENILVVGNKNSQRNCIVRLGINSENFCEYSDVTTKKWIMDKTNNEGVDIFFECVGKNELVELAVDVAAPSGEIVYVGNPYSDMNFTKEIYWKILRNQLDIKGTWNSSYTGAVDDDWHYVISKIDEKRINPKQFITHSYSLEELFKGFEIMRDKTEEYIKIMAKF